VAASSSSRHLSQMGSSVNPSLKRCPYLLLFYLTVLPAISRTALDFATISVLLHFILDIATVVYHNTRTYAGI
jgi:hypothetical protein